MGYDCAMFIIAATILATEFHNSRRTGRLRHLIWVTIFAFSIGLVSADLLWRAS